MRYSIEPRDRIYVKGYGFLSFAKNVGKNLSNKYSQKLIDTAKKSTTDAIKTASKRAIQKTADLLTGNCHFYTTMDLGRKWLADFNAGKIQLVSFDRSNNNGSIDVEMDGSVLEEKSSFKMLGLTFSYKLDWCSYIVSIAKTASKKIGALIRFMKFLSPEILPYSHVWNTVVTSGLVPLVATWNC